MGQFFTPGFTWISSTPEAHLRVIGLDTGGSLLLVTLEAPPTTSSSWSPTPTLFIAGGQVRAPRA